MQITLIACPFKTSYGAATESLKTALERQTGNKVQWVASNCGCGDDVEIARQFQMPGCKYFDAITITDHPSRNPLQLWLKLKARKFFYYFRARKYGQLSAGAEVVNFQQTLNAYGSTVLFHWLNRPSRAARVVTIHELDRHQLERPESNKRYNKADAIIVQQQAMKDQLVGLGVKEERVEIVLHGTDLPATNGDQPREGVVFYGGHHPWRGKGIPAIFQAMAMLKTRLRAKAPSLKVHGYFSREDVAALMDSAAQSGLNGEVAWLNQLPMPEVLRQYQASQLCVLPFTGSFAGLAAATTAATETPVIGTKHAGIPEHIGEHGVWLENDTAEEIAAKIERLLNSENLRRDLARGLRRRAEQFLAWDVVADSTLAVFERALRRKAGIQGQPAVFDTATEPEYALAGQATDGTTLEFN
jgi:glycosyltransferase involved in cell wall biosynthesis